MFISSKQLTSIKNALVIKLKPLIENFDVVYEYILTEIQNLHHVEINNEDELRNKIQNIFKDIIIKNNGKSSYDDNVEVIETIALSVTPMIDIQKLKESHEEYIRSNKNKRPTNNYRYKTTTHYTKKRKSHEMSKHYYNNHIRNFYHSTPNNINYLNPQYHPYPLNTTIPIHFNPPHMIQPYGDIQFDNYMHQNPSVMVSQTVYNNTKVENLESSTITISNVPDDLNVIEIINNHFKSFGKIINIEVSLSKKQAHIKFSNSISAINAINSKVPVFGNRFIEVGWYKKEIDDSKSENKVSKMYVSKTAGNKSSYMSEEYKKLISERKEKQKEEKKRLKLKLKVYEGLINKINKELAQAELEESRKAFLIRQKAELYQKIKLVQNEIGNITSKYPKDLLIRRYEELKQRLKVELKRGNIEENNSLIDNNNLKLDLRPKKFIIRDNLNDYDENDIRKHFEIYGNIVGIENKNGEYIIEMDSRKNAERALRQGYYFHGKLLNIEWIENDDV